MECGQNKVCHIAEYGKPIGAKSAVCISELTQNTVWDKKVWCSLCDECIGTTPRGIFTWIWWLLGISFLLVVFGNYNISVSTSPDMPVGFPLIFLGWILGIVGGTGGLLKIWGLKGSLALTFFLGWTPIPAIILLVNLKKINRTVWVNRRMREKADQVISHTESKFDLLAGIANKDADKLTDEEKKLLEEKRKNDRRVQDEKEALQLKANQKSYNGAIFGIVITVIIALVGLSTYGADGYMTWLGIRLSLGGFFVLLGAFLVYDILTIIYARRKISQSEAPNRQNESFNDHRFD
jgi:hypothetical protein